MGFECTTYDVDSSGPSPGIGNFFTTRVLASLKTTSIVDVSQIQFEVVLWIQDGSDNWCVYVEIARGCGLLRDLRGGCISPYIHNKL